MDKVVNFLEKHVQWVALGLGALWLLFMAWSYVITPPAAVVEGDTVYTGGKIDEAAAENEARQLEMKIQQARVPEIPVENYAEKFTQRMAWTNAEPIQIAGMLNSQTAPIRLPTEAEQQGPQPVRQDGQNVPPVEAIAGLPEVPTPEPADNRVGRSAVEPVVALQPGQAPPPQPAVVQLVDKDWVTQAFKISIDAIEQGFAQAKVPMGPGAPPAFQTFFLKVEVQRQELSNDGNWVNETIIQPVDLGIPREQYPEGKVNRAQEQTFINWAQSNQPAILQPGFYVVGAGDPWAPPGEVEVAEAAFNPANFLDPRADLGKLTPEQKKQVMDARRENYRLQQQQRQQQRAPRQRTPRGGDEGMAPEEMFNAPRDADRAKFGQVRRTYPTRNPYGLSPEEMAAMEGMAPEEMMGLDGGMMGMPGQPNLPNAGIPGTDYPAGAFDPMMWQGADPITVFAHDDTVQAGKTYRYRMRYILKNPLHLAPPAIVKDPKLSSTLGIPSEWSDWAEAVTIPEKVQFFIAQGIWGGNAKFDVFAWVDGVPQMKQFSAAPGDRIGGTDAGTDFTTKWTVVTLPTNRDEDRIVIVDGDGRLMTRSAGKDRSDPLYQKLKDDAKAAAEAQNVAAAVGR